jgi:hypothetical protein
VAYGRVKPTCEDDVEGNVIHPSGYIKCTCISLTYLINKRYSSPVTGLEWPRGFQEVKVPRFHDNGTGWW